MATAKADYTEQKQSALLDAAVALAKTPGVHADEISIRIQRLKETLNDIVFAEDK
jgi:hypothetical protein